MVLKFVIFYVILGQLCCVMINYIVVSVCVENINNYSLFIYKKGVVENNLLKFK